MILVRIDSPDLSPSEVEKKMKEVVSGDLVPFSELERVTDWASIKKVSTVCRLCVIVKFH